MYLFVTERVSSSRWEGPTSCTVRHCTSNILEVYQSETSQIFHVKFHSSFLSLVSYTLTDSTLYVKSTSSRSSPNNHTHSLPAFVSIYSLHPRYSCVRFSGRMSRSLLILSFSYFLDLRYSSRSFFTVSSGNSGPDNLRALCVRSRDLTTFTLDFWTTKCSRSFEQFYV